MAETITDARTRKTSVAEVTTDGTMLSTAEVFVDTDAFPFSAADVICGACAKTLRTAAAFVASRARRRSATAAITLRASVHHNYIAVAAGFSSAVESSGAGEGCRALEMRRTGFGHASQTCSRLFHRYCPSSRVRDRDYSACITLPCVAATPSCRRRA